MCLEKFRAMEKCSVHDMYYSDFYYAVILFKTYSQEEIMLYIALSRIIDMV